MFCLVIWPNWNFLDRKQKNTSIDKLWGGPVLLWKHFTVAGTRKSWLYEGHHVFFEASGHFDKKCDASGAKTEADDLQIFLQDSLSKVYIQIFLLV